MQVSGKTQLFPIIGDPVDKVVSPPSINRCFAERRINALMVPLHIPREALSDFWNLLRASESLLGCSITYPHKQAAFDEVDHRTPRAERLGALNTIRRHADGTLEGDATDGRALCTAILASGYEIAGKTARVIGAGGGAGLAIVDAFCEAGIYSLVLEELDPARRQNVQALVTGNWPEVVLADPAQPAEILVNATTLGSAPSDPLPVLQELITQADCVCDVVGAPDTPLIQAATRAGKVAVDGKAMGEGQAESQIGFLFASEER